MMRFLVDAHLSPVLVKFLKENGFDAIHTRTLSHGNDTKDADIIIISMKENRIVISKDSDFYYSMLLHNKPFKLILIKFGNTSVDELIKIFEKHFLNMMKLIEENYLVEVYKDKLLVIK